MQLGQLVRVPQYPAMSHLGVLETYPRLIPKLQILQIETPEISVCPYDIFSNHRCLVPLTKPLFGRLRNAPDVRGWKVSNFSLLSARAPIQVP